jgi:hypothetical protein
VPPERVNPFHPVLRKVHVQPVKEGTCCD